MSKRLIVLASMSLIVLCALVGENGEAASGGNLDVTFNPSVMSGEGYAYVYNLFLQANGKVVLGGAFSSVNGALRDSVARLNSDGSLDASFSPNSEAVSLGSPLAVQADGKVIAPSLTVDGSGNRHVSLARLNANGSLDAGFNTTLEDANFVNTAVVQSDGKIIIAGQFNRINGVSRNNVARLNSDGSVDNTFYPGKGANSRVDTVSVQADGRILIGGLFTSFDGATRTGFARLNPDGSLDAAFNVILTTPNGNSLVQQCVIQPDGKIIIAGTFQTVNGTLHQLNARLNPDGSLDASFNHVLYDNSLIAIALQTDGKLIISGQFIAINNVARNRIARLNLDGSLDMTFDAGAGPNSPVLGMAAQPDGKFIIGGFFNQVSSTQRSCVARLNSDGSLDSLFNPTVETIGKSAMALQPNGKLVVVGPLTTVNGAARHNIARLNADGSLDAPFNPTFGGCEPLTGCVYLVAAQTDGKILVGGYFTSVNGTPRKNIARLNADGSLDNSFDPGTGPDNNIYGMAVQGDGKIVVYGDFANFNDAARHHLARLNANGSLDPAFVPNQSLTENVTALAVQSNGKVIIGGNPGFGACFVKGFNANGGVDFLVPIIGSVVASLAIQADDMILVGGSFTFNSSKNIFRLRADGTFDYLYNPGTGANDAVYSIVVQPNGKSIIGGLFTSVNGRPRNSIARLNANGTLDPGFTAGIAPGFENDVNQMLLQPDGKLLIGGLFAYVNGTEHRGLARIFINGATVCDFDNDGKTDRSVYRNGTWYILNSSNNALRAQPFGLSTDRIVPGDYDGDNAADIAVFRDGTWYILQSSNNFFRSTSLGQSGDAPVPADYDGDGKSDLGVFRQGVWLIINSSTGGLSTQQFGANGDKPVAGDYDGDGRADLAVFRNGVWYVLRSSDGGLNGQQFGVSTDIPAIGDYNGDGKIDLTVFRNGVWYIEQSSNGGVRGQAWGISTDRPVPGDYDGDGKTDVAVFRPTDGYWYVLQSSNNALNAQPWGTNGDQAVPAAYIP